MKKDIPRLIEPPGNEMALQYPAQKSCMSTLVQDLSVVTLATGDPGSTWTHLLYTAVLIEPLRQTL